MNRPRRFLPVPLARAAGCLLVLGWASGCERGDIPNLDAYGGQPDPAADGGSDLCAEVGANCGPVGDGFGNSVNCGTCTLPETCGGGGTPSVCGGSAASCAPRTCAALGFGCGPQGDGCGGPLDCGFCAAGQMCGGGGPSACGAEGACTNLCLQQQTCASGVTTTVSGKVVAPTDPARFGAPDPLYNAIVYIPNGPVAAFTPGVSCDQGGADVSGSPLVLTHSGSDGSFTLENVPVGQDIPLVIQLGRWRRQTTINVAACTDNELKADQTRLPRNRAEGDIPLMAMVTGSADPLECVLRKIGIDDSEFTVPASQGGKGRVQLYVANGATDSTASAPDARQLWMDGGDLDAFDLALFACEGMQNDKEASAQQNVINYANLGGRIFATHYSYTWLYNDAPFSATGTWNADHMPPHDADTFTGIVDTSFAKGLAFSQWLDAVDASTSPGSGEISIRVAREDLIAVVPPGQRWIYTKSPDPVTVQHYTFDTPVGAAEQCGRVLFSDFHVTAQDEGMMRNNGTPFPAECDTTPLSPQERVLEFMLFDLSSCVEAGASALCTPQTCEQLGFNCGPAGDGCGGTLDCGACPEGQSCGFSGEPSVCGSTGGAACTPSTCAERSLACGPAGDGCGGLLNCGSCAAGESCGGGGVAWVCGRKSGG